MPNRVNLVISNKGQWTKYLNWETLETCKIEFMRVIFVFPFPNMIIKINIFFFCFCLYGFAFIHDETQYCEHVLTSARHCIHDRPFDGRDKRLGNLINNSYRAFRSEEEEDTAFKLMT